MKKSFDHSKLKHKFLCSEFLTYNYSQADQDIFVLSMLNGKHNGTYLEIGCNEPYNINNTALLESDFNWKGLSLDINDWYAGMFNMNRKNRAVTADATTANYIDLLKAAGINQTDLDYLSIDCEPAEQTLRALKQIPLDYLRFAVITFEHNCYVFGPDVKIASREYLISHGYVLVVSNVSVSGRQDFEDWYVHPALVDMEVVNQHLATDNSIKFFKNYLYITDPGR